MDWIVRLEVVIGSALYMSLQELGAINNDTSLTLWLALMFKYLGINALVVGTWYQLKDDFNASRPERLLWYSLLVAWPLATTEFLKFITVSVSKLYQ